MVEPNEVVEFELGTDAKGLCVVPEPIPAGTRVRCIISVVDPPRYEWGVPAGVVSSYPLTVFAWVREELSRRGFHDPRFKYDTCVGPKLQNDNRVIVEFDMTEVRELNLHFQVKFQQQTVIYSSDDRRNGTANYTTGGSVPVQLKVTGQQI